MQMDHGLFGMSSNKIERAYSPAVVRHGNSHSRFFSLCARGFASQAPIDHKSLWSACDEM